MVHLIHRKGVPLLHSTVMILCDEGDGLVAMLFLLINYSIYSIHTMKCVGVILVTFLLSYSLHFILPQDLYSLPRIYTVYLGKFGFYLGQYGFDLGSIQKSMQLIDQNLNTAHTSVTSVGCQFVFYDVVYHIQPCRWHNIIISSNGHSKHT